ncbi:hypothetical protein LTR53_000855 [Teratosphaeriaceae sp. CCFEE 6253]|nr:hypothetical protein LTR53_000855 [Teratosphaeriaceae sp. CCFEE 6253]
MTTNTNPGNFANRDHDEVVAIASMGGKASHGPHKHDGDDTKGPEDSADHPGRNADGTFTKGSDAAKAAGHLGGQHSHGHHEGSGKEEGVSELAVEVEDHGRNPDGTFKKGGEAAREAGHKSHGGH